MSSTKSTVLQSHFIYFLSFLSHNRDGLYFPDTPSSPYLPGGHSSPNRSPKKVL